MKPLMRTLIALSVAMPLGAFGEGAVYVQSVKAKLLAEPHFNAALVAEARRGDTLAILERQERWYKVAHGNQAGWISKLLVSDRAPMSKTSALGGNEGVETGARRRASVATTAGAARGLASDDRMRASQGGIADYVALEKMEQVKVGDEEALAFLAKGLKP